MNSTREARKGPVRPPTTPARDFCKFGSRTAPIRVPHGPRRIWKILEIPVRSPSDTRTSIARGPCGVLRIIRSDHKCTAVSSRTVSVAWCDHENSTSVKFLRALHSALWARNRMSAKIVRARGWMWLRHYIRLWCSKRRSSKVADLYNSSRSVWFVSASLILSRHLISNANHYCDVIMDAIASQITGLAIVYSTL